MRALECPVARYARLTPQATAIRHNDRDITFRDLHEAACATASDIAAQGVHSGSRIAFAPTGGWQDVVLLWAIWRLQAVACPLNTRLSSKQQGHLARRIDRSHFFDQQTVRQITKPGTGQSQNMRNAELHLNTPATVLFTSGSDGEPKAVVHTLGAHFVSADGAATNIPITSGDRWLWNLPCCHVSGIAIVFRTMLAGATLVIDTRKLNLKCTIESQSATHVSVVSTQLYRFLGAVNDRLPTLKAVLLGGGPCGLDLIRTALDRTIPLYATYGLTEMASQVTATSTPTELAQKITAGRVLPGRELKINPDGEILVRGETLSLGYLEDGNIEPIVDSDGWFATRDMGQLDHDGRLTILGRKDQMFISGGENIYPEVIETALLSLPNIAQAVVVPVVDAEFGQRPVAFVQGTAFSPPDWQRALREQLPAFMVPIRFLKWPEAEDTGMKPSRRWFTEQAARRIG